MSRLHLRVSDMDKPFLRVTTVDQAREFLRSFGPLESEEVSIEDALFRVLARSITAQEDIPGFNRSTMDGFAVRAADTFGASESSPALFRVVGEVSMGELTNLTVKKGDAVRIWTGGALPAQCDAVVMVEHTEQHDAETIEVLNAVAPFDNVVRRGEDFQVGETLLSTGNRLRPQDLGLLAAMGRAAVSVYRKPAVAVASSGDEVVPVDQTPPPGCVRDVNRYTLTAMITEAFAQPVWVGIAVDELEALSAAIERGVREADVLVISGGSSMGSRDLVIEAVERSLGGRVLFHGVSVSPGKPLILASVNSKPVFGLPGHPVSAMICFEQFVVPLIRRLEGEAALTPFLRPTVEAVLGRNVPSKEGRTDYLRVRLERRNDHYVAVPVPGKSGMISSMVRADGVFRIEAHCEGLYKGDVVTVHLFSNWMGDLCETKHLPGHETAGRSSGDLFTAPRPERLSGV